MVSLISRRALAPVLSDKKLETKNSTALTNYFTCKVLSFAALQVVSESEIRYLQATDRLLANLPRLGQRQTLRTCLRSQPLNPIGLNPPMHYLLCFALWFALCAAPGRPGCRRNDY